MTQEHPITPPQTLINKWWNNAPEDDVLDVVKPIATQAARWGADQELEACCEWLARETPEPYINALRAARRPRPPSLKEQALNALNLMLMFLPPGDIRDQGEAIRRALEALPE